MTRDPLNPRKDPYSGKQRSCEEIKLEPYNKTMRQRERLIIENPNHKYHQHSSPPNLVKDPLRMIRVNSGMINTVSQQLEGYK